MYHPICHPEQSEESLILKDLQNDKILPRHDDIQKELLKSHQNYIITLQSAPLALLTQAIGSFTIPYTSEIDLSGVV
jgi:hypothetical protein